MTITGVIVESHQSNPITIQSCTWTFSKRKWNVGKCGKGPKNPNESDEWTRIALDGEVPPWVTAAAVGLGVWRPRDDLLPSFFYRVFFWGGGSWFGGPVGSCDLATCTEFDFFTEFSFVEMVRFWIVLIETIWLIRLIFSVFRLVKILFFRGFSCRWRGFT